MLERRIFTGGNPSSDIKKRQRALARSLHLYLGTDHVLQSFDMSLGNFLKLFLGLGQDNDCNNYIFHLVVV